MIAGHSDRATFPEIQMSWFRTTRQTTMNVGFRKPSGIRRFPQRGKSFAAASKVFLLLLAGLAVCNPTTADNVFKADFTISPSSPAPGQPVSFTDATRGLPTSWSWDFGDGSALLSCNNSNARNPMHTYAVAGTYTVMLRIILLGQGSDPRSGSIGLSDQVTKSVPVSQPGVPPVAPSSLVAIASSSITTSLRWLDNSNNETGFKIERKTGISGTYAEIARPGPDRSFFNDSGLAPTTPYCYRVSATDADGDSGYSNESCATTLPPPGAPPVAQFAVRPGSAEPGQTVAFFDASTGTPSSWSWSFGDGSASSAPNPTHVFSTMKSYTVSLTVTNALGSSSTTRTVAVTAPLQIFSEFHVPATKSARLIEIALGPDGNLWATADILFSSGIVRISPADGSTTVYTLPYGQLNAIATGPDGNLWFTEQATDKIGRITTAGVITEFSIPTAGSFPTGIAAGPDGNLWFMESGASKIGRITTAGVITEFSLPTAGGGADSITEGPDGNLWFTDHFGNKIGRITTAGVITEFPIPSAGSQPYGITAGSDGNLWFTEIDKIGRITTAGVITEFPIPSAGSQPYGITAGSDGHLWLTEVSGANS